MRGRYMPRFCVPVYLHDLCAVWIVFYIGALIFLRKYYCLYKEKNQPRKVPNNCFKFFLKISPKANSYRLNSKGKYDIIKMYGKQVKEFLGICRLKRSATQSVL